MHIDFTINPIILRLLAMVGVIIVLFVAAALERLSPTGEKDNAK
jgi:hypothetical protein